MSRLRPGLLVKDLGGLALWYPGQALLARLPRGVLPPLAALGGDLKRRLKRDLPVWREELRLLFGDRPLPATEDEILKRALRGAFWNDVEVLRYPNLSPATIGETAEVQGREHLDRALAAGRGAIVLIGHFGANQMIMPALGHLGYPMSQLSAPPTVWADLLRETRTTPLWERVLERRWELEQRLPVQHINVFKFLRPAFTALKENRVLGLAFDGGGGVGWTRVPLLARQANLSVQPVQLWRKTGAALIPGVVVREPGERVHRVILEAPLTWTGARDRAEEDRINLAAYVERFAAWVARYPDHYLPFVMMRRAMRGQDLRPLFEGWPRAEGALSAEEAEQRLRAAGDRT